MVSNTGPKPLFRRLEILKLLHGRSMRTAEIAEHFKPGCDDSFIRTIQSDLAALRDGIDVFGTTVKVEDVTESHSIKSYKSTVHPLFLALNLTELFALLRLLEGASTDPAVGATYKNIFDSIYSQITDYARSKIDLEQKHQVINVVQNRLDEDSFKKNLHYLLKSGAAVQITYTTSSGARINRRCRVCDYNNGIVTFFNEEKGKKVKRPYQEIIIDRDGIVYK